MTFKVGDTVRVVGYSTTDHGYWEGQEGTIFTVGGLAQDPIYVIKFSDKTGGFRENHLVLVNPANEPLNDIPLGLYIGANRYDTDVDSRLHLWTADGQSFDIIWDKS